MARKTEALTSDEIAAVVGGAYEAAAALDNAASRMEKAYAADPGNAVEVLRQLASIAESAMRLSRMVAASALMHAHVTELRAKTE